jgi:hypothetical protein
MWPGRLSGRFAVARMSRECGPAVGWVRGPALRLALPARVVRHHSNQKMRIFRLGLGNLNVGIEQEYPLLDDDPFGPVSLLLA